MKLIQKVIPTSYHSFKSQRWKPPEVKGNEWWSVGSLYLFLTSSQFLANKEQIINLGKLLFYSNKIYEIYEIDTPEIIL